MKASGLSCCQRAVDVDRLLGGARASSRRPRARARCPIAAVAGRCRFEVAGLDQRLHGGADVRLLGLECGKGPAHVVAPTNVLLRAFLEQRQIVPSMPRHRRFALARLALRRWPARATDRAAASGPAPVLHRPRCTSRPSGRSRRSGSSVEHAAAPARSKSAGNTPSSVKAAPASASSSARRSKLWPSTIRGSRSRAPHVAGALGQMRQPPLLQRVEIGVDRAARRPADKTPATRSAKGRSAQQRGQRIGVASSNPGTMPPRAPWPPRATASPARPARRPPSPTASVR